MGEEKSVVLYSEEEKNLGKEATSIEKAAASFIIRTDDDYVSAGEFTKNVKSFQKKVEEYWEPMRASTYSAYKAVMDHKKDMLDPLKKAESVIKKKMGGYQMEQKRKAKEQEEMLRRLAQEELDRKLAEAAEAEGSGDAFGAEFAMAEAEVMDNIAQTATVTSKTTKVRGVSHKTAWEITKIDLSKLPTDFAGVLIRPADEKAIMKLIKESGGNVKIPGVEYEETVSISVRAS